MGENDHITWKEKERELRRRRRRIGEKEWKECSSDNQLKASERMKSYFHFGSLEGLELNETEDIKEAKTIQRLLLLLEKKQCKINLMEEQEKRNQQKYFHSVFSGQLQNGLRVGLGRHIYADGFEYHGCFSNNLREGDGVLQLPNGTTVKTMFKQNRVDSSYISQIRYPNGDVYIGYLSPNGLPNGLGVLRRSNNEAVYVGEMRDGEMDGWGLWRIMKKREQKKPGGLSKVNPYRLYRKKSIMLGSLNQDVLTELGNMFSQME
eukprot:TRINITY_DN673_c0_g5_i1.p1 TRINITY_DN673_c0_g5~~TRINITY_DN673_c0_g5_i1.p1  ORF type:complete len:278 (+),score=40.44 TRINITY_DN673_c0_g5_i1:48-836(+)